MPKYISLLRGINVSGQKKIKMADLRGLYSSLGFQNISSYIQSGNLVFDSESSKPALIAGILESAIKDAYSFEVPIIVISAQELAEIYNNNPFVANADTSKLYVAFLKEKSNLNKIDLSKWQTRDEQALIKGKQIYLYYPQGYGKSKLTNNILERELNISATTRNWRTVHKLVELSKD
ncbi:MAG TPA: DUF1697 domain-containing protein [Trueperaceae bacterium]|nr:DUF1697 domain-containing protein [Trueperaceae bacterium]